MSIASPKTLDLPFVGAETCFYRRNHIHVVIPGTHQSMFSYDLIRMRLLFASLGGKVFERLLVDLEVFPEEIAVKDVGRIDVVRNVMAQSKKLGFLAVPRNGFEKQPQDIQTVDLELVDSGQIDLGLAHARKGRGQGM